MDGTLAGRLVMGGSFRFQYLWSDKGPIPVPSPGNPVQILVALPIESGLAQHLLDALRRAFPDGGHTDGLKFVVKPHPMCPVKVKSLRWSATIASGTFEEAIQPCSVIIYVGSSTGLEALAMGRRVIRYRSELLLDLDVGSFISSEDIADCMDYELRSKLLEVVKRLGESIPCSWVRGEVLKRAFAPVNGGVWLGIIDELSQKDV